MRKDFLRKIKFYIKTKNKNIACLIKRKRLSSRFQIKRKRLSSRFQIKKKITISTKEIRTNRKFLEVEHFNKTLRIEVTPD